MSFKFIRNDITKISADAIVNAANNELLPSGGVCGAIFKAAGFEKLSAACKKIGYCETGKAVITPGYALPAKYIIHTAGPVWSGGVNNEAELLYSCYINSLELARKKRCRTVAFPVISTGAYGYPKESALKIAENAIKAFLYNNNDMTVYLVFYNKDVFSIGEKRKLAIQVFIDDNYIAEHTFSRRLNESSVEVSNKTARFCGSCGCLAGNGRFCINCGSAIADNDIDKTFSSGYSPLAPTAPPPDDLMPAPSCAHSFNSSKSLNDAVKNLDLTFSQALFKYIDEKGMKDTDVYKRANIDKRLFSKIRSNKNYKPSKNTALALAVALRLNIDETCDLLIKAGYALSHSNKFDVIVEYFIRESNFDIFEINEALFEFEESLLGA